MTVDTSIDLPPAPVPVPGPGPGPDTGIADLPPVPRRGALGLLSRAGIALVGAVAGIAAAASPAAADCQGSPCCHLASCRLCLYNGKRCNVICPVGYRLRAWYCASGARTIGCGECTPASSCWTGPFHCSIWWDDAAC
jgi:hypothetical protein